MGSLVILATFRVVVKLKSQTEVSFTTFLCSSLHCLCSDREGYSEMPVVDTSDEAISLEYYSSGH